MKFKATINGDLCEGKVQFENGKYYLCQNIHEGDDCKDKLGYNYSWQIGESLHPVKGHYDVAKLELFPETLGDLYVGCKVLMNDEEWEVLFKSGELLIFKTDIGNASMNYTISELCNLGCTVVGSSPVEPEMTELTIKQIAEKFGVSSDKIRIKE